MKIGDRQRGVLRSLAREPYPGGWYWENHSTTITVLDSLVKRGLAERYDGLSNHRRGTPRYRITDQGQALLAYFDAANARQRARIEARRASNTTGDTA